MASPAQIKSNKTDKIQSSEGSARESFYNRKPASPYADFLSLQNTVGNRKLTKLLQLGSMQPKLKISQPGDKLEQEADVLTDKVMNTPVSGQLSSGSDIARSSNQVTGATLQRKILGDGGEPTVQQQGQVFSETLPASRQLHGLSGAGQPLLISTRDFFEPRFGQDLSHVRIHSDGSAAATANSINAKAFTYGRDVVFGRGEYRPQSGEGKRLLAHELAHVLQQKGKTSSQESRTIHRQPSVAESRDLEYEIDRLTTREIEAEILAIEAYIPTLTEGGEEYKRLSQRHSHLVQAYLRRRGPKISLQKTIKAARESVGESPKPIIKSPNSITINDPSSFAANFVLMAQGLFFLGAYRGYETEIPPGVVEDIKREMIEHLPEMHVGYVVGIPIGLWDGLVGLIEGFGMILSLAVRMTPQGILQTVTEEVIDYARDAESYISRRQSQYKQIKEIIAALTEFGEEVSADPTTVLQLSGDLGFALGQEVADRVANDYFMSSPFDKGKIIGNIAGQILFEVLFEIIMYLATAGIGNAIRAVGAGVQGVRAGGRAANIIRRMLETSPALRRLVRALTGGADDITDIARAGERGAEVVESLTDASKGVEKVKPKSRVFVDGEYREAINPGDVPVEKTHLRKGEGTVKQSMQEANTARHTGIRSKIDELDEATASPRPELKGSDLKTKTRPASGRPAPSERITERPPYAEVKTKERIPQPKTPKESREFGKKVEKIFDNDPDITPLNVPGKNQFPVFDVLKGTAHEGAIVSEIASKSYDTLWGKFKKMFWGLDHPRDIKKFSKAVDRLSEERLIASNVKDPALNVVERSILGVHPVRSMNAAKFREWVRKKLQGSIADYSKHSKGIERFAASLRKRGFSDDDILDIILEKIKSFERIIK